VIRCANVAMKILGCLTASREQEYLPVVYAHAGSGQRNDAGVRSIDRAASSHFNEALTREEY